MILKKDSYFRTRNPECNQTYFINSKQTNKKNPKMFLPSNSTLLFRY